MSDTPIKKIREAKAKRPPKTLKERRFVKAYLETGNATESAVQAGYNVTSRHSAEQVGYENMRKLDMGHWFHTAGLTHEAMAQNTTVIALTAQKRDHFSGEMYDDYASRLNAMKFAADLMGLTDTKGATNINQGVIFQITRES